MAYRALNTLRLFPKVVDDIIIDYSAGRHFFCHTYKMMIQCFAERNLDMIMREIDDYENLIKYHVTMIDLSWLDYIMYSKYVHYSKRRKKWGVEYVLYKSAPHWNNRYAYFACKMKAYSWMIYHIDLKYGIPNIVP